MKLHHLALNALPVEDKRRIVQLLFPEDLEPTWELRSLPGADSRDLARNKFSYHTRYHYTTVDFEKPRVERCNCGTWKFSDIPEGLVDFLAGLKVLERRTNADWDALIQENRELKAALSKAKAARVKPKQV